ncbi:hypothetical protein SRB17_84350 [Streptomyces sp. RB17]|nr:hypothetical protein [Streptomyces sp. RB17]
MAGLHELLLAELRAADQLDLSQAAVDGSHLRAMKGGAKTGPSPVDRGRTGSKHHVIVEAHGIDVLYADRGYDYDTYRRDLRGLGIR